MRRYFFHLQYGENHPDTVGTEFATLARAREAAVRLLSEVLRDHGDSFWDKPEINITVADEQGLTLWRLDALGTASPSISPVMRSRPPV